MLLIAFLVSAYGSGVAGKTISSLSDDAVLTTTLSCDTRISDIAISELGVECRGMKHRLLSLRYLLSRSIKYSTAITRVVWYLLKSGRVNRFVVGGILVSVISVSRGFSLASFRLILASLSVTSNLKCSLFSGGTLSLKEGMLSLSTPSHGEIVSLSEG